MTTNLKPGDLVTCTRTDGDHTYTATGTFSGYTEDDAFRLGGDWHSSSAVLLRLYGVIQTLTPAPQPQL